MRLLQLTLLILLLLMTGCQSESMLLGNPETPYPPVREPLVGDILHLPTGIYVTAAAMYDQASRAQVVYVGETHDNPASHRLQIDILQALAASNPGKVSLAMEMFTPKQQPGLDRWVAGELTEKEFLKDVDWLTSWRMNFALYRDLLTFCRDQQIPILALNANKDLQKQVSRTPFAELTTEQQQLLPELDHSDPYQRAMVEAVFSDHKMGQTTLD
ncbi:MAG: ChaN family lipoprotein, partial [Chloroflexi bacterium]|nr:ChaN family lipoprotein [Chloroflexota bacterium]